MNIRRKALFRNKIINVEYTRFYMIVDHLTGEARKAVENTGLILSMEI